MPSPIAHLAAGYVVYRLSRKFEPQPVMNPVGPVPSLFLAAAGFSLLPDIDSVVGLLLKDLGRYHNNVTHSLFVAAGVAFVFACFMKWRRGAFGFWFLFAMVGYSLHVLMDAATWSRGVMALWPLDERRFLLPVYLFYGLHWSQGWLSSRHLLTLITELAFAIVLVAIVRGWLRRVPAVL